MGADKFDNLSADMFDEFDIDMDDGGSNKKDKGSETLKNVSELLKSTSAGALRGVRNELKSRFGNTSEVVEDTIATVDDFKKLQQDLAGEISPAVNTMKQITLRSMPMIEKIMPKKWYDSIKKKLEESIIPTERRRDMEAEARNETIRSSIQSIFEGQTEIQKQMIVKQDTERMVDRKLSEEHFKASYESLSKIGDSVATVAEFLTGTYTSYLKKSLELKYQGIFVLRDIHKATVAIAKIAEDRLREISKNTGIPEYMKTGNLKSGGLAASRGSRLQTFSEYQSSFRSTFMQNISKSVMGGVKNVTRGLIPQLDMMTSMMEMMGGGEKLTPMKLVAMGLGLGAQFGAKKLFGDKLKQYGGLRDLIENKGQFMKSKGISWLQQFAERHRGEYGTLLGWIADKIPSFNKQAVRNSMLEGANEAVPFDNTTRQTIVEVMPRHLERIGNLVEALQQTLAPNAKINQMTFNVHQRKLTTVEEAREDFISKEFGSKEDRARRMGETMGKFRAILLTNNHAKKGTANATTLQDEMTRMEDHLKRFLINSASASRFFDVEAIANYKNSFTNEKGESKNPDSSPYINLVFDGIPKEVHQSFAAFLLKLCVDSKTHRLSGMMVDRINAAISERMNDTNIQEMMARASEGFGQSQLFSDIATHKEGVKNAGMLNMLDPKLKKKKTTYYNPKTGRPYTQKELEDLNLDWETQDDAERAASYEMKDLLHLQKEEEKLRRLWKKRGGKEGDFADKLSGVLGGAAYAVPDFINNDLTKATDWLKGKYQKTKQGVTDFFSDDTVIGRTYSKAKSKYDESEQKKPHVNSVVKTGPTTYVISASDLRMNRYSETINVSAPLQPGTLPVEEINKLCSKKHWVFDIGDPNFRYSEITEEGDIPEHYEEVKPESAYTVAPGASGTYSVGGTSKRKRRSTKQETVRTAADVAEEAVAFDADSRTSLRRWIPDKLDRIIELLGGGKPTTEVKNVNKVGFFGKMKGLFHRNKPEVKEAVTPEPSAITTVQSTKKEESKAPEGDLKFEGAAESLFHSDFRLFAQRQIADNQSLLSAIMGIPGGGKGKGILGSIIGAGGKLGGGIIGAYGRMMAAMMSMYGNIAKGVLSGGGRVIGGALKAAPAVGKALLTPAKWLGKASWWTTKKTVGGAWKGGKWLGNKAWKGITYPFRKKGAKPLEEPVPDDKQYYQDANGRWHGPDGRFVSEDQVPEQYKTAQAGAKPSLVSRIKDRVSGWFSKSKPSDSSKKKEGEEDDNIWNRKGWGGLFRTAWDGAKKVGSGIAKFFSKEKEGDSEVPKAGRKLGIDLLLNKITEIYDLLKEERDRRVEKEQKEEEAKKDAEQAEANMSAEEQQAANEKRLEERKKKMAEDAAAKAPTQGGKGTSQGQGTDGGQDDDEGGGLMDDAMDWAKGKTLNFARNKLAAGSMKLLRKTKWGRRLLKSPAGKLMRKGVSTLLQKGKIGTAGRIGKTLGGVGRVLGRATGSVGSKVASLGTKLIPGLAGKAGMLGGVGSKATSFAGKAAAPLALAAVGYGAFKGLSASQAEDSQYAQDLGKEGLLKRAFKTAINPVRQGRIIASTVRNMFGLTKDLSNAGVSKLKVKSATAALDKKRISKLKELGASEEDLKRFEALSGDDSNEALKEKYAIFVRYTSKKQNASTDAGSSKKPEDAAKAVEGIPEKDKEETGNGLVVTSVQSDKGGASEKTTESPDKAKPADKTKPSEESKLEKSSKDKITTTKLDDVKAVLEGVPQQAKSGWGSKLLKAAAFASPVGLLAMGAKKLNDKFDLTGKAAKGLKWAGAKALGNLKNAWKGAKWLGSKYVEGNKVVGKALLGGAKMTGKGLLAIHDKVGDVRNKIRGTAMKGIKSGLGLARGKAADLVDSAAGYLEDVAANAGGEGLLTDLKNVAATGSRAIADKLKGGQEERGTHNNIDGAMAVLDRFSPNQQRVWDKITATKPKSSVNTASSISDKQMAKHDGVSAYLESKQPSKIGDVVNQQAAGTEALVQATTAGNGDIVGKLTELVQLMKEQIVVTSDSKVAQEKATSEGAQKALTAAMAYARETAQNAIAASRPKPRRAPAIDVSKPVPA